MQMFLHSIHIGSSYLFFELSWVDKVTSGTYSFVSFISNVPSSVELVITQSTDHIERRLTLQFINGISRVFQKLLKFFNCTINSTSFAFPSAAVFLVIFTVDLNDSESVKLLFGSSLKYSHRLPDIF